MARPPRGSSRAPVFVVGHPRSGTTLLRLILNEHPRIVIPPEAHIVSFLRRCERKYGDLGVEANRRACVDRLVSKQRMQEWGLDPERMRQCAMEATPPGPAAMFSALMGLWLESTGKQRWGEKTPGTYRYLADVHAWFPDAQVVHIVRDGRDVAVSNLTPPFSDMYDKGNVYEVALRWRDAIHRCRRARDFLGDERLLQIRYEDLTSDAEAVTRRLCDFLGEEFVPQMLQYHRNAQRNVSRGDSSFHQRTKQGVDRGRVERWRTEADDAFLCAFEGIAGRELSELGYALSGKRPSASQRLRILYERLRPRRLIKNYKPRDGHADRRAAEHARPGEPAS